MFANITFKFYYNFKEKNFMGFIINIEGTDGCGKHTQSEKLVEALKNMGKEVITQSFPNYDSPSSGAVKMYLGGEFGDTASCLDAYQASALFAIDRLCTMKKLDMKNKIVVLDRYTNSNLTFQNTKILDKKERDKFEEWLLDFEFGTLKLPVPDVVIFLDMPVEKSIELAHARKELKTGGKKDIHEADDKYLEHCYKVGMETAKKYGWTIVSCVDENGSIKTIKDIHKNILEIVLEKLNKK